MHTHGTGSDAVQEVFLIGVNASAVSSFTGFFPRSSSVIRAQVSSRGNILPKLIPQDYLMYSSFFLIGGWNWFSHNL